MTFRRGSEPTGRYSAPTTNFSPMRVAAPAARRSTRTRIPRRAGYLERSLLGTVTASTADNRPLLEWAKADVRAVGTAIGEAERERLARERSSAAADAPQPRLKVKVEAKITPA